MPSQLAASHGEPSYVWRTGQHRRLEMILRAAPEIAGGSFLEVGCGLGLYLERLGPKAEAAVGVEFEPDRAKDASARCDTASVVVAANEALPFPSGSFDVVLTNEVIEHVLDDTVSAAELVRVLRPGGKLVLFCPNRWYPVEQHGVYWRGTYHFGNIPLVNYLPDPLRDRLAPHVRAYSLRRLRALFADQSVREISHRRVFGGYDNLVGRLGLAGRLLRRVLQGAEGTPMDFFALSHMLVLQRVEDGADGRGVLRGA
ncbi:MAG: class I SAM-dependent methyltransferase [Acidimicrobiales bacterium]